MSDDVVKKSVWRLNTGDNQDFNGDVCVYIYDNGLSRLVLASAMGLRFVSMDNIYAYQTNRTKPAKYR